MYNLTKTVFTADGITRSLTHVVLNTVRNRGRLAQGMKLNLQHILYLVSLPSTELVSIHLRHLSLTQS